MEGLVDQRAYTPAATAMANSKLLLAAVKPLRQGYVIHPIPP